jgi:hypothetical protein
MRSKQGHTLTDCPHCGGRFARLDRHLAGRGPCGRAARALRATTRPAPTVAGEHRCGEVCAQLRRGLLPSALDEAGVCWEEHRAELLALPLNPGWRHPGYWEFDELAERWRADPSWWERPDLDAAAARSTRGMDELADVAPGITRRIVRRCGQLRFLAATGQLTPDEIEAIIGRALRDPTPRAQGEARAIRDELQGRPRTPPAA